MKISQRLLQEARHSRLLFGLTVLMGVITGALILFQAHNLSHLVNSVFLDHFSQTEVAPQVLALILIVFLRAIFSFLNGTAAASLSARVKSNLRSLLLDKISRLGPAFTRGESTGELTTTALQGVEALDAYFSQYLPQILIAALLPVMILLVVFPLDTLTGVVFLVTAPLIPFFMSLIGRASENETRHQWQALSRLGAYFLDTLQGITTLKTLGQSRARTRQIEDVSEKYRETTLKVLRITFLSALALELLATLSTAVVAVEIGLRLLYSKIAFEQAFFILLMAPEFYQPLRQLGARYHAGMTGVAAAKRIYEVLDTPEPLTTASTAAHLPLPRTLDSFTLELQHVSFTYPQRQKDALQDVSMKLDSGKSFGLIGRSGAGKSTLMQLLLRFIQPGTGRILLNGQDLSGFILDDWRRQIGWVPQQPALLDTTILENIRLAKPEASLQDVRHAAAQAHLDSFVMSLSEGYDTRVYEKAVRVSSGQAQRIALARAFLKDAPILMMDEPTAHLDDELEEGLNESVQRLMQGRTTLIIAHRLSTLQKADMLFLLDGGKLSASGTHAGLLASSPLYYEMVRRHGGGE
ncbi:MAG: thiol reductant ABC exporter subunit CydD [Anaerolineaceae bacterium]